MRRLMILPLFLAVILAGCSRSPQHNEFATVDEAVQALVAAAKADDTRALVALLGTETAPLLDSGDPVQDKNGRERFVEAYEAAHSLEKVDQGTTVLNVGEDKWPFPFPLIQVDGRWRFAHPHLPRHLHRLMHDAGLTLRICEAFAIVETRYDPDSFGASVMEVCRNAAVRQGVDAADADAWVADIRSRTGAGDYFFSANRTMFVATK